ncbi:uncharacterized protein LOC18447171 isoform X1 [Amborella trichopoda]|uniref:uncharacterized protein LOC18447171 isoform X1 n=1 Tax=Amborella trichopoda TaxID=13333 RepID=UPI0009C16F22|nr:uncharacterized protein LOC18447171 isoform X1 [Amborella trichopoda]|eukprot:XP_020531021.1 uncharacterized protein LOC18447171 isoform X1 [Amborella trichopoda]
MKAETKLDSAVFQLTPTRTRCDLVIFANGTSEKIVSGLLDPFLTHMRTAQHQIAKGGYSIQLEPGPGNNQGVAWFTKGTVERFVRFVSTPEVLERVNTIESEITQIEEAIAIQGNENIGFSTVEDHATKSTESNDGGRSIMDSDAEKAIVLYKQPGAQSAESNGSTTQEENSKVQLLRVLETRRTMLQKEQGMAFARAVAAGFDMDHLVHLISFAECFGASRLKEACIRFMELWKVKHETSQWLEGMEFEAAEEMSSRSEFSSMNGSGFMLSSETSKLKEFRESWSDFHGDIGERSHGKTNIEAGSDTGASDPSRDKRSSMESQVPPVVPPEYYQGQYPQPMVHAWPLHAPQGAPVFPAYPMQGMPYYQGYPGAGAYFQPPYPPMEDPRFNMASRMDFKRQPMSGKEGNLVPETWEGASNTTSHDQNMQLEVEREGSSRQSNKRRGRMGKSRSRMVVIRNINYIASKGDDNSGSESGSEVDEEELQQEVEESQLNHEKRAHKAGSSKNSLGQYDSKDNFNSYEKGGALDAMVMDNGNWQAFQNCLLRDDRDDANSKGHFSSEKAVNTKRRHNSVREDITLLPERSAGGLSEQRMGEFDTINGNMTRIYKQNASEGDLAIARRFVSSNSRDSYSDIQIGDMVGTEGRNRRASIDDSMMYGQPNRSGLTGYMADPVAGNELGYSALADRNSVNNSTDDLFIVSYKSSSHDLVDTDNRTPINMDSELPLPKKTEDPVRNQVTYEPDDISMMPERGMESVSHGWDPTVDYEMQVQANMSVNAEGDMSSKENGKGETDKKGMKKSEKDKKSRTMHDSLEKRKMDAIMRKGKPSKLSPLAEAQARADKMRSLKADLQKMKKEKEEEQLKHLEARKRERQTRIAARCSLSPVPHPSLPQKTRTRLPAKLSPPSKLSPSSLRGSKFHDSETGSSSPGSILQKPVVGTVSSTSADSSKNKFSNKLNGARVAGNGLSRSFSSLSELKKDDRSSASEAKATSTRNRRLSDHQIYSDRNGPLIKSVKYDSKPKPKPKPTSGPEIKKQSVPSALTRPKSEALADPTHLRIRTKASSDVTPKRSVTKESTQRGKGNQLSVTADTIKTKKGSEKIINSSNGDANPIIEKSVVSSEHDKVVVPIGGISEVSDLRTEANGEDAREMPGAVSVYAAICEPPSPIVRDFLQVEEKQVEQPNSNEANMDSVTSNFQNISSNENPYQAPYARNSSLEDPRTSNLEYGKALPLASEMESTPLEIMKAHVVDSTGGLEHTTESMEKPSGKEPSKGFRRLLKFGRKNHSSAASESSTDSYQLRSEGPSLYDQAAGHTSTTEVPSLRNLITQDDSSTGGTPQKASRPFSLLLPFRSKGSEKKR